MYSAKFQSIISNTIMKIGQGAAGEIKCASDHEHPPPTHHHHHHTHIHFLETALEEGLMEVKIESLKSLKIEIRKTFFFLSEHL